ncbi:MAG: glycine cleavage system protein H [Ardenticatenaceae bacterium]|nr:glycine cleavage system protein H [Ardenticatenaceae bacterium]MCB9444386.1 glycine cleavage system protein H [Ardenticatenaceae bacterium]
MAELLEYTLDKFTFKVATDRFYNPEGVWAKADGSRITVGVSDFFQQHNGDVAFAEVWEAGTAVSPDDEFATIETIKVDIELPCPISGTIVAVNENLELEAEVINQDPYGEGWLAAIEAADWAADRAKLMTPEVYFEYMKVQAQKETGK